MEDLRELGVNVTNLVNNGALRVRERHPASVQQGSTFMYTLGTIFANPRYFMSNFLFTHVTVYKVQKTSDDEVGIRFVTHCRHDSWACLASSYIISWVNSNQNMLKISDREFLRRQGISTIYEFDKLYDKGTNTYDDETLRRLTNQFNAGELGRFLSVKREYNFGGYKILESRACTKTSQSSFSCGISNRLAAHQRAHSITYFPYLTLYVETIQPYSSATVTCSFNQSYCILRGGCARLVTQPPVQRRPAHDRDQCSHLGGILQRVVVTGPYPGARPGVST
jgi:hypothetical protein